VSQLCRVAQQVAVTAADLEPSASSNMPRTVDTHGNVTNAAAECLEIPRWQYRLVVHALHLWLYLAGRVY
jgi:hypothetical protein